MGRAKALATDFTVRRAEPRDAEGIAAVFRSRGAAAGTLQNPYPSVAAVAERMASSAKNDYSLVAVSGPDQEVIGNGGLHSNVGSPRRAHAWGLWLAVRDDWQGKGVGTKLMEALIDLADNWLGALRIELNVYTDNARAIALYRRFGFVEEGVYRAYALREGVLVDSLAMARLNPKPPRLPD
jgi:L-phenylalanine/L-methionine N-acetyltransferase